MKILLCPDKFKGSATAFQVCEYLKAGLLAENNSLEVSARPMADGGDGSVEILKHYFDFETILTETVDPLMRPIRAYYYRHEKKAYIELALASGRQWLAESERNPMYTSTYGTGLQVRHALDNGCQEVYMFLGGSTTNDGGTGVAAGLGFKFLDADGCPLQPVGENLAEISTIQAPGNDAHFNRISLLCDVINPLYGPRGAAYVYAAQKGANVVETEILDKGLRNLAAVLTDFTGKDISHMPGTGAAGGVAASLVSLTGAQILPGFSTIAGWTGLEQAIIEADLVITGEGQIDASSLDGKVAGAVAELCKEHHKQVVMVAGGVSSEKLAGTWTNGARLYTISELAENPLDAMKNAGFYLFHIGKCIARHLVM